MDIKGIFKFRRPWETPPREDSNSNPPTIKIEPPDSNNATSSSTSSTDPSIEENFEVFRFDKDSLTLTSEKRINRKSLEETIVAFSGETSSSSLTKSKSSSSSNNNCATNDPSTGSKNTSGNGTKTGSKSSLKNDSSSDARKSSSDLIKKKIKMEVKVEVELKEVKVEVELKEVKVEVELKEEFDDISDAYIDVEEIDEDESFSNDEDDDEDEEFEITDDKVKLEAGFPEGRNKERKNSKWADYGVTRKSSRLLTNKTTFCNKAHRAQVLKKLTSLLKKRQDDLTEDDKMNLTSFPELAKEAKRRLDKRHLASERLKEEEDPEELLDKKCVRLASVISRAKYVVVYTGAGISTSASIPDYRGPNGIWTLLRKGQSLAEDLKQFPQSADPTSTHMAIKELHDRGVVKHIVSQNVDGLHLRSGIPKVALSEVHGNMYIEVCLECHREYVRLFDVTENTKRHHHKTGRYCYHCGCPLKDSVVLFGEKGSLRWPINWCGAEYHVDKADVILCLGSSLKVLRRYPWLWGMSKPAIQRPKLYIVNLQWTPKDRFAALKINGRCDEVISTIMDNLQIPIPLYKREEDAIFAIATSLHASETSSKLSKDLSFPDGCQYPEKSTDLRNYFRFEPVFCKEVRALNQVKRKVVDGEDENMDVINEKKPVCGIGWLGNALSVKPKKKKLK